MEQKETKLVFKSNLARHLVKMGNEIVDIKPYKFNKTRTVFVFKKDEKFLEDFNSLISKTDA